MIGPVGILSIFLDALGCSSGNISIYDIVPPLQLRHQPRQVVYPYGICEISVYPVLQFDYALFVFLLTLLVGM